MDVVVSRDEEKVWVFCGEKFKWFDKRKTGSDRKPSADIQHINKINKEWAIKLKNAVHYKAVKFSKARIKYQTRTENILHLRLDKTSLGQFSIKYRWMKKHINIILLFFGLLSVIAYVKHYHLFAIKNDLY